MPENLTIERPLTSRSGHWPTIRAEHLKSQAECQACGARTNLEVHHIKPFHLHPELELDLGNLITLCEGPCNCHLTWGHFHAWKAFNPNVIADTKLYRRHLDSRPVATELTSDQSQLFSPASVVNSIEQHADGSMTITHAESGATMTLGATTVSASSDVVSK